MKKYKNEMERNNRQRLITEADALIGKSDLNNEEKENLTRNIRSFLSEVKYDQTLKDGKWQWFGEDEGKAMVWT